MQRGVCVGVRFRTIVEIVWAIIDFQRRAIVDLKDVTAVSLSTFLAFEQGEIFSPGGRGVFEDPVHDAVIAVVSQVFAAGKLGKGLRAEETDVVGPALGIGRETFPDFREQADAPQGAGTPGHSPALACLP